MEEISRIPLTAKEEGRKEKAQPKEEEPKKEEEKRGKIRFPRGRKFWLGMSGALLLVVFLGFFLILPLRSLAQQARLLRTKAAEAKWALTQKDLVLLKNKLGEIGGLLDVTEAHSKRLGWLKIIPRVGRFYQDGQRLLAAAEEGVEAGKIVIEAVEPYQDFLGVSGRTEGGGEKTTEDRIEFLLESINSLKPKLDLLEEKIKRIESLVDPIDPTFYPVSFKGWPVREKLSEGKRLVAEGSALFREGKPLLEKVDFLLGKEEPRKYLVLFQNDGELRPTGGFWTAYGILQVENGKITPLISEDIYDLDKRFNSRIPAPAPIKNYLKNVFYWHLRDMNLSPDFEVALKQFLPHYQKVAREKEIDGVIAVDTDVLVSLLKVLGQIGVPGWGNFNAEPDKRCFGCPQVVYQLEELADRPVGTWKTDRKGFLAPIMHSILANAMGAPREKIAPLAGAVWESIRSKHMLFFFPDERLQRGMEKLRFAGKIDEFNGDYFHLNDSNFGGSKANLFITQQVKHEYERTEKGEIRKKVTVKYQNRAPASDCNLERGGLCLNAPYRDWFRFYVPQKSQLEKLTGSEVEVKTYEELGKTVFEGFFGDKFPVYPKGIGKIVVEYKLPFESEESLPLLIQKQPGKDAVKHEIWVNGKKQQEVIVDGDVVVTVDFAS